VTVATVHRGPAATQTPDHVQVAQPANTWRQRWWPGAEQIGEQRYLARTSLLVLAILAFTFVLHLLVVSRLQHDAAQTRAFNRFRVELAKGVAPTGQLDSKGRLLRSGAPVALLDIPAIGLHQVVSEGTSSAVLETGPGHLRNTVLPGQAGTSTILARMTAYGGPFGEIHNLRKGDKITVTTGIGISSFLVLDVRSPPDVIPRLKDGNGRLVLVTATGAPFVPTGVVAVDADLTSAVMPSAGLVVTAVPPSEVAMGTDTSSLWVLAFLLQATIIVTIGAVWSWRRWGKAQTWIVFFPLTLLLGLYVADQVTRLLPNLL
jgi:sortase A